MTVKGEAVIAVPFTRDISQINQALHEVQCFDKTQILDGFSLISKIVFESWGSNMTSPVDVIVVTDGGLGLGPHSLSYFVQHRVDYKKSLPFKFSGQISVACLISPTDNEFRKVKEAYEILINQSGMPGNFLYPEKELNSASVEKVFQQVISNHYKQYEGTLQFGDELKCNILLCPPPSPIKMVKDFEMVESSISDVIDIKGFLTLADVASPPVESRHLVLPKVNHGQSNDDDVRVANLCVFLHGAFKVENMCALVQVSDNWFGLLFACSDSKKKSNLMLALFEPGPAPVPWLGNLFQLGPLSELSESSQEPFPVRGDRKPSYSSSPVVWIKPAALQGDVQRLLRHARKLPDKTPHFYKELNRLKRHALCIGFYDLLQGLASTFEHECPVLPPNSHPECANQLRHAARELRSFEAINVDYVIHPAKS